MKRISLLILAILALGALLAFLFVRPGKGPETAGAALPAGGAEYYTCPMHPSVIAYKPGACPICGMALVRRVAGGRTGSGEGVTVTGDQRILANVTTFAVRSVRLSPGFAAPGVVAFAEPLQSVVAARSRGRIERLFVNRTGTVVRRGEPLLSLYSPDVSGAEEEYLVALSGSGDSSGGELVAASRRRLSERFGLGDAEISRLAREHDVRSSVAYASPIAGTVIRRPVVEGQYVEEGMTLFELADLSRVWVIASVAEQQIRSVRVGQQAEVALEAYPGEVFRGRIVFVEPVLEADSRTARVRVELPNGAGKLKPNMYAHVTITAAPRDVLAVPVAAVLFTGKEPLVWVETSPGRFVPRAVDVGESDGTYTEIVRGLVAGEMVAATGGFLIDSESRLEAPARGDRR